MTDEAIYELVSGFRWLLLKDLGPQDYEDALHDAYLEALSAFARCHRVLNPQAYVRGIVHHHILAVIKRRVHARRCLLPAELAAWVPDRREPGPEALLIAAQEEPRARAAVQALKPRYREIMVRFYQEGRSADSIRDEMQLSDTQYRLAKSRARQRALAIYAGMAQPKLGRRRVA